MLIRSQDKTVIVNLDNIDAIIADGKIKSFNGEPNSMTILGKYSTMEKSIKVLDMIQKAYCVMRRADCLNTGTVSELAQIRKESREEIVNELRKVYVFQMPSDEEVSND